MSPADRKHVWSTLEAALAPELVFAPVQSVLSHVVIPVGARALAAVHEGSAPDIAVQDRTQWKSVAGNVGGGCKAVSKNMKWHHPGEDEK